MKHAPIKSFFVRHWVKLVLGTLVMAYIAYFSWFTVLRYRTLYAHYFDLGIMHQTVYNTYMAIRTGDYSRFLELTNPHGYDQIKRMAVHNDILLALLAPFYFLYSGPEMLLVLQTVSVALGALAVYGISKKVFEKNQFSSPISLFFSFTYLMYPPLQRANQFDFHAVVLATPLLLFMFLFYLQKKYAASVLCIIAALLTKEQVGLTVAFFGFFIALKEGVNHIKETVKKSEIIFAGAVVGIGIAWFFLSMTWIIPAFRHGVHFAMEYFGDFGDSPTTVFLGLIKNPQLVSRYLFKTETYQYLIALLGPVGFLSLFSPFPLLIATPEIAINLLSKSGAMRNIYFHYTAVITPFIMISAIYGLKNVTRILGKMKKKTGLLIGISLLSVLYFSATLSPLPYSAGKELYPILWPHKERILAFSWQKKLADENIKIMVTGHMAPVFASRRYLYNFSDRYDLADYIVLSTDEIYNYPDKDTFVPVYEKLKKDPSYSRIYASGIFEVFKKL